MQSSQELGGASGKRIRSPRRVSAPIERRSNALIVSALSFGIPAAIRIAACLASGTHGV